jgi:hypothetical protein
MDYKEPRLRENREARDVFLRSCTFIDATTVGTETHRIAMSNLLLQLPSDDDIPARIRRGDETALKFTKYLDPCPQVLEIYAAAAARKPIAYAHSLIALITHHPAVMAGCSDVTVMEVAHVLAKAVDPTKADRPWRKVPLSVPNCARAACHAALLQGKDERFKAEALALAALSSGWVFAEMAELHPPGTVKGAHLVLAEIPGKDGASREVADRRLTRAGYAL